MKTQCEWGCCDPLSVACRQNDGPADDKEIQVQGNTAEGESIECAVFSSL